MVGDVAGGEAFDFLSFTDLDDNPFKTIPDVSVHRGVQGQFNLKRLLSTLVVCSRGYDSDSHLDA